MSIGFKIKITRKLILVSRPPIHFRIKQAMFDQFWKSCINSWWFTSAALSLQFLKIKCSMKRSRGIWNSNNQWKIQTQEINILHSYGRSYPGWSKLPRFTVLAYLHSYLLTHIFTCLYISYKMVAHIIISNNSMSAITFFLKLKDPTWSSETIATVQFQPMRIQLMSAVRWHHIQPFYCTH